MNSRCTALQTMTDELENPSENKCPNVYPLRQSHRNTVEYGEHNNRDGSAACVDRSVME